MSYDYLNYFAIVIAKNLDLCCNCPTVEFNLTILSFSKILYDISYIFIAGKLLVPGEAGDVY